ncbi:MAG: mechanosensitive ion channel family protein [Bacteroidia bacterium]|nr:mechanosensitive ion channel family protein [Bacteroidia bacterium]
MINQFEIIIKLFIFSIVGLLIGFLFEKLLLKKLEKLAGKTRLKFDDIFLKSLKGLLTLLLGLAGFSIAVNAYGGALVEKYHLNSVCVSFFITAVSVLLMRIFTRLIKRRTSDASARLPSTSIILNITRIAIFLIGIMLVMQVFGVSVTPILTALGVGGLAVALALQETLSNLFSGIQLIASKNIRNGDFIQLSSGEKGYVQDITWRNTIIRELSNNLIVIPNSKLSSTFITNFSLPEPELSVLVEVTVGYGSDLEQVEKVTVETARNILKHTEGAVTNADPFIRYHTFTESGISFSVILRGNEFTTQYLIKHEFIKALHRNYGRNNIELAVPQRGVTIQDSLALTKVN